MSAFFLAINRDQSPFQATVAQTMMQAIAHFGHDAEQLHVQDHFALGYQSLWTVPEEQGEQQPLYDEASGAWLLFYGRIDNRDELLTQLSLPLSTCMSDAALLLAFYLHQGEGALGQIIGPFVFVIYHSQTDKVIAARDCMGGRSLVYRITDQYILIATYELALIAHPSVEYRFNHARIARMLARLMSDKLESTIAGVTPLQPGELLSMATTDTQAHKTVFYRPDPARRIRLKSNQDYAAEFKRLLRQAVVRRMRSIGPVSAMLSGGFDSVPMSILLSQELAKSEQTLTAFSWVFDRFPEADERQYSTPVCEQYNIQQICINCDDIWPQLDEHTHVDPVMPVSIPYSEYQQVTLQQAQERGIRTVMTGIHGDLLYGYIQPVLIELLKAGRIKDAIAEFRRLWFDVVSPSYLIKHFIIAQLPFMSHWLERRRLKQTLASDCLQDDINALLYNETNCLWKTSQKALRPAWYQVVFSGFAGEDMAFGRHLEAKYAVERRYPFRDRDLCEFMAAVPSEQLHFNSTPRPIVRRAFDNELSDDLKARTIKTDFSSVISAGVAKDPKWRVWFDSEPANWHFYVKKCYFGDNKLRTRGMDIVQWQCGYYDYWKSVCYNQTIDELG